jgi:ubiquinone/menaquinone biosynthesis C-methylase UbiE
LGTTPSYYVHGTHPDEQRRLALLNDLLNQRSMDVMGLSGGERILDLGSGLGQLTLAMARAAGPNGRVVGIERSAAQIAQARRLPPARDSAPVEFREGDVLALELPAEEWGAYDVAHTRFVLEHVPRPLDVVRSMVRAVKSGGRVVLQDDDHDILRLWPEPAGFMRIWSAYVDSYLRRGNDPYVGRKVYSLLVEAGARPTRIVPIWFGTWAADATFAPWVQNLDGIMVGARDEVLSTGAVDASTYEAAVDAIRQWGQRSDAVAWYSMAYAEGVKVDARSG